MVRQRLAILISVGGFFVDSIAFTEADASLLPDKLSKLSKTLFCVLTLCFTRICVASSAHVFAVLVEIDVLIKTTQVHEGDP